MVLATWRVGGKSEGRLSHRRNLWTAPLVILMVARGGAEVGESAVARHRRIRS
jgi:hypothetical protein